MFLSCDADMNIVMSGFNHGVNEIALDEYDNRNGLNKLNNETSEIPQIVYSNIFYSTQRANPLCEHFVGGKESRSYLAKC